MAELDLTKRQQEVFDFIKKYSAKYGYPPTVRDIGKAIGKNLSVASATEPRTRAIQRNKRAPNGHLGGVWAR